MIFISLYAAVVSGSTKQYKIDKVTYYSGESWEHKDSACVYWNNMTFPSGTKTYTFVVTYKGRSDTLSKADAWLGFTDRTTLHGRGAQYTVEYTTQGSWTRTYTFTADLGQYKSFAIRVDHPNDYMDINGYATITYSNSTTLAWK